MNKAGIDSHLAFHAIDIKKRSQKPRKKGLTMVLDKGIGLNQAKDLVEAAPYIDIIKLGWATPRLLSKKMVMQKVALYREKNIHVGNGGTLFEIAYHQGQVLSFLESCREMGLNLIEISDGIIALESEKKAEVIKMAKDMDFIVMSEIGKKDPDEDSKLSLEERILRAKSDLNAGATCIIIEAREAGKGLGIYDDNGAIKEEMAKRLALEIGIEKIMFESPEKAQQGYLILHFGPDVNLGNIRPDDIIPLETLRRGIRGDTFGKL